MVGAEDPQLQLQAADTRTEATNTDDDLSQGKATLGYQLNISEQSRPDDKQQTNTRRIFLQKLVGQSVSCPKQCGRFRRDLIDLLIVYLFLRQGSGYPPTSITLRKVSDLNISELIDRKFYLN